MKILKRDSSYEKRLEELEAKASELGISLAVNSTGGLSVEFDNEVSFEIIDVENGDNAVEWPRLLDTERLAWRD